MSDEFDDVAEPVPSRATPRPPHGRLALPIPELIADVYANATAALRARLIECLLRPVGPLALVAIAAGTFGAFLHRRQRSLAVSLDDAARISADQMLELARYVEQLSPDTFQQVGTLLMDNPIATASVSGSLLLLALRAWRRRGRQPAAR